MSSIYDFELRFEDVQFPSESSGALTQRRPIGASPFGQKLHFCLIPLRALGGFHRFAESSIVRRLANLTSSV